MFCLVYLFTNFIEESKFREYIVKIVPVITMVSTFTVILQIYEWSTILEVLIWQKGKSLGEMMHILWEYGNKNFQALEKFTGFMFIIVGGV